MFLQNSQDQWKMEAVMSYEIHEQTNILSAVDISEEQNDIELGKIVELRMNDEQTPTRVTLDDL